MSAPVAAYKNLAETEQPLDAVLAERWSPRAFDPAYVIDAGSVTTLLEAARWAPSASNHQPRRFIVGRRGSRAFETIASTLNGRNRLWAPRAALLVLAIRVDHAPDGTAYRHADYDTGQAVAHLQLQAHALGLVTRQIGGFDAARAAEAFGLEAPLVARTVTAVGRIGSLDDLDEATLAREQEPRERLSLDELVLRQD